MKFNSRIMNIIIVFLLSLQLVVIVPGVSARNVMIEITEYSVSSDLIVPGDEFNLDMTVKNNSDKEITKLYLEVEDLSGFSVRGSEPKIQVSPSLVPGASDSVSIAMVYNGEGDGQIPVSFSYSKDGYTEQITEERYLSVNLEDGPDANPSEEYLPILKIENKESLYTSAGSQFEAAFNIQNTSIYPAREVLIKASFAADAPFSFPGEQMFYFRSLGSGETKTLNLTMLTDDDAVNGTYIMKLDYEFANTSGEINTASENLYVRVADAQAPPSLEITPQVAEEAYLVPGEDFELFIMVKNQGQLSARDISISLEGLSSEAISLSSGSPSQYFDDLEAGTERKVRYMIKAVPNLLDDSYPVILKAGYTDQTGAEYSTEQEILLKVRAAEVSGEEKPMIVLKHYQTSPLQVLAGENFTLYMDFFNNSTESINDIKVILNITESSKAGNVFSIVDAGNTFYIDSIGPQQTEQRSLQLHTDQDEKPESYQIIVTMKYKDPEGIECTSSDMMNIMVKQLSLLEVGNIRSTGDMKPGKLVNVYCTYYNTGRTLLTNLIIKMEGDFEVTDELVYIGDMEKNSSGYYHGTIKPQKTGEITGKLIFSYQDQAGEPLVLEEPFTMNITEETAASSTADTGEQDNSGLGFWYIIIPVVVAGAATAGWQIQRKNQQNEDGDITSDE